MDNDPADGDVPPAEDIARILLDEQRIAAKVAELGTRIAGDYAGSDLVLVSILKGALPFLADLMRRIPLPLSLDFLEVSSYGISTESSGVVRILKDLAHPIEGRDVLVVEDVLDTGFTLNYVLEHLRGQHPASLRLCTLLDKPARRIIPITVDYRGFEIPDEFVVGSVSTTPSGTGTSVYRRARRSTGRVSAVALALAAIAVVASATSALLTAAAAAAPRDRARERRRPTSAARYLDRLDHGDQP